MKADWLSPPFPSAFGRIVTNGAVTWLRIVGVSAATLLSTRYLLKALGLEAFGVYAIASSIALLTSFLTAAMQATTLRAISMSQNAGEPERQLFSGLLGMHLWISLAILVVGGVAGTLLVVHVLAIPDHLLASAEKVFMIKLSAAAVGCFLVPYEAFLQSKGRFEIFALLDLACAWLILPTSIWLISYSGDQLTIYATITAGLTIASFSIAVVTCWRLFPDSRPQPRSFVNSAVYRYNGHFFFWNLFGAIATVARIQGLMVLVNIAGGPIASAALAIGHQLQSFLRQLSSAVTVVVTPQIYSKEAQGRRSEMIGATLSACKLATLVAVGLALPLLLEFPSVLQIWLVQYHPSVSAIASLLIFSLLIDQTSAATGSAHMALGRIARYQIIAGGISMLFLPVGYAVGRMTGNHLDVLYVLLAFSAIVAASRLFLLEWQVPGVVFRWASETLARVVVTVIPAAAVGLAITYLLEPSLGRLFITIAMTGSVFLASTYWLGCLPEERRSVGILLRFGPLA